MTSHPRTDGSTPNTPDGDPSRHDPLAKHPDGEYGRAGSPPPRVAPAQANPSETSAHSRPAGFDDRGRVKRSRFSALWVGLIAAAVVLILLIVFIAQNLKNASIHFLGFTGQAPVGLMLLIAVIGGVLLVAVPGSVRILQLRKALKANTPKDQRRG